MRTLMLLVLLALLGGGAYLWLQDRDPLPVPSGVAVTSGARSSVVGASANSGAAVQTPTAAGGVQREGVRTEGGLAGRLLQNGAPLADVTVIACVGSASNAEERHRAVTDAAGMFHIRNVGRRFWLAADGERVPHHWRSRWIETEAGIGDVAVVVPGSITGIVRDEAGSPIVGAKLTRVISFYRRVSLGSAVELTAVSDERGKFRFERVAKDQGKLRCQAAGYQMEPDHEVEIDVGQDVTTEIVLRAGMTLRGLVMDPIGHPLPGAKVRTEDGQEAVTDVLGQFTIEDFRRYAQITIRAEGHLPHEIKWLYDTRELQRVKLERAATLRGVVVGSHNQPGSVYVERSDQQRADASETPCYEVLYEKHDIVRDGRFSLPGFALADFDVTVRIPGVGVCGPMRVELRDDCDVEFVIVPQREVTVSIRNVDGERIADAKLVRDEGIVEYPERYGVTGAKLLALVGGSYSLRQPVPVTSGTMALGVPVGEGVAFFVDAPGYLRAVAVAPKDALPERIDVVMARAGSVRGVVHGGMREAYAAYVSITALDASGAEIVKPKPGTDGSVRNVIASAVIHRHGGFVVGNIAPGRYRAQVSRSNTKSIGLETQGVSLIDEQNDARATTDFVVEAGHETNIELTEPPLGRLIGRVLLHGGPVVGAMIVAMRPAHEQAVQPAQDRYGSVWSRNNWDDEMSLGYVAGQRSGKGGAFAFLYRDAGPVEVRVRHADGLITSSAFVVNLPPPGSPGSPVVRDFEIPAGEIRGRYALDSLGESERESFTVTLFPVNKTLHDPFFHPHHGGSLAWNCPRIENSLDGSFRFSYLRPGKWLIRVHHSGDVLLWQKLVDVHNEAVDVGDLPVVVPLEAEVTWSFAAAKPGNVLGVWLRVLQATGTSPIWAGTFAADKDHATCKVIPGNYLVTAFGWRTSVAVDENLFDMMGLGLTGEALTEPVQIQIRSDGSVLPNPVLFSPLPGPAVPTDHK